MSRYDKMLFFCAKCGAPLQRKTDQCSQCGLKVTSDAPFYKTEIRGAGGIGWSDMINDRRFARYRKNSGIYILIWTIGLAVLIPGLLLAFGEFNSFTEALTVAGVICGMFMLIGLFFSLKFLSGGKQWEGTVTGKDTADRKVTRMDQGSLVDDVYTEYIVHIETTKGKHTALKYRNNDTMYHYLTTGDKIRYHGKRGLKYIEKFDKINDTFIFCAACGFKSDIRADFCLACGCPLLKGYCLH